MVWRLWLVQGSASGGATLIRWLVPTRYLKTIAQRAFWGNEFLKDSGRLEGNRCYANCLMRAPRVSDPWCQNVPRGLQVCYQMVNAIAHGFRFGSHSEGFGSPAQAGLV